MEAAILTYLPRLYAMEIIIPIAFLWLSFFVAMIKLPSQNVIAIIQNFAAGCIFAAFAVELSPKLSLMTDPKMLALGLILGLVLIFIIKQLAEFFFVISTQAGPRKTPFGLFFSLLIDLIIINFLLAFAYSLGLKNGQLMTIALAFEVFYLGLFNIKALVLRKTNLFIAFILLMLVSLVMGLVAIFGFYTFGHLQTQVLSIVFLLGIAALLFIVSDGLLRSARLSNDTPILTTCFFIGFSLIFIVNTQL